MGLYDDINIHPDVLPEEYKWLADPNRKQNFQTKDLDNYLIKYEIRSNGELYKSIWTEHPWLPDDAPDEDVAWVNVFGGKNGRPIEHPATGPVDYTGAVTFYDMVDKIWYEFLAVFVEGRLLHPIMYLPSKYNQKEPDDDQS